MLQTDLVVLPNAEELASEAAKRIAEVAATAIHQRGRCTIALAGGSTPEKTYRLMAGPEYTSRIVWSRTFWFFGDERVLPYEDPRSNYHMAANAFLSPAHIPPENIYPIPTDLATPAACASAYAAKLADFFLMAKEGPPPVFDLILLGLGDDGHTASLFPNAVALDEQKAWVTWSPPGVLPPPVDRVTLTFATLNAARQVMFLVSGAKKTAVLREILEGRSTPTQHPAIGVRPVQGRVTWLLDEAARGA